MRFWSGCCQQSLGEGEGVWKRRREQWCGEEKEEEKEFNGTKET